MVAKKESEISLATSFASAMLEASPDSVMVLDQDFRIVKCNSFPLDKNGQLKAGKLPSANTVSRPCTVH
jgi:hypothetical protein